MIKKETRREEKFISLVVFSSEKWVEEYFNGFIKLIKTSD